MWIAIVKEHIVHYSMYDRAGELSNYIFHVCLFLLCFSVDCEEAAWSQEEAEGDVCRGARSGHGRPHQGMVPATHQTDIPARIWYVICIDLLSEIQSM